MIHLNEHFKADVWHRHTEWLRQQRWFIKSRLEKLRSDEAADKAEQALTALAAEVVIATELQILQFNSKLDSYDEATVAALMENQELLDQLNSIRLSLLDQAFVIEDGRRVFKTEDGTKVFDEFGEQLSPQIIEPDQIPDHHPTAETFFVNEAAILDAEQQRSELFEFQERLDAAREQLSDEEITEAELVELDAELFEAMPSAAKQQLPEKHVAKAGVTATQDPDGNPAQKLPIAIVKSSIVEMPSP